MRIGQKLSIPLLILIISNIITGVTEGQSINYYLLNVCVLVLFTGALFIKSKPIKRPVLSWLLLLLSIPTLLDNDLSNMTSIFIFLFSVSVSIKTKKSYTLYFTIYLSILLYKFNLMGATPSQIIGYFAGASFLSIFYFEYIHKSKESFRLDVYNKEIDPELIHAVLFYVDGYSWDENPIAIKRQIGGRHLRNMITKQYDDMGFKNITQFAYYICEMQNRNKLDKNEITE